MFLTHSSIFHGGKPPPKRRIWFLLRLNPFPKVEWSKMDISMEGGYSANGGLRGLCPHGFRQKLSMNAYTDSTGMLVINRHLCEHS